MAALVGSLLMAACGSDSSPKPSSGMGASVSRGQLLSSPPSLVGSYSSADMLGMLSGNTLGQELLTLVYTPTCTVNVYHIEYTTVGGKGEATDGSGALMVPSGTDPSCQGPRPIVLYAHGTSPDRNYNIAAISSNDEGLILAAVFAAKGYVVVAPNYAGYDTSPLTYHPYLIADQQADDMIDALSAARSALPVSASMSVTDNHKLFITGYSQGGFVAMATHRAMQAAGATVTASGPMSGPYAVAAFGDAVFLGDVNLSAVENVVLVVDSYQAVYGNVYGMATDMFAPPYAPGIESLLPSTTPISSLYADGKLPQNAIFSSTPPAPQYASITPSTTPANLAPAFAMGFGTDYLVTNPYRLAYIQDTQTNPDGGFPTTTTGVPAAAPGTGLRQDFKSNDLRNWSPTSPMLLCAGSGDPSVFYLNTQLMQGYWATHPPSAVPVILDIDSPPGSGDPYAALKEAFAGAKAAVAVANGADGVLQAYHASLVPPFCLTAVKSFFDGH